MAGRHRGALILVVGLGGPTMFARIGVMRALNRRHVRDFNPPRKEHHRGAASSKRSAMNRFDLCRYQQAGW